MKVLLVDDNPTVAEDLKLLLPSDIELTWAPGTREALTLLDQEDSPQVVILDLCLPPFLSQSEETEGFEFLTALKQARASDIPVVVLSALPRSRAEAECLRRGASAYLEKPCSIKELLRHLNRAAGPRD